MKCAWLGGALVLALACPSVLAPQAATTEIPQPPAATTAAQVLAVAPGEELVLELHDPINTRDTRKGARVSLTNTTDVFVNGRIAVPRGSTVHATVVESKRPGRIFGKAKVRLDFNEIVLPDGTTLPLSADLSRAGWWGSKGSINQTVKGEGGKSHDIYTVGQGAAQGAIFGSILGGGKGAARGAAAGAAVSALAVMLERGPDLDLPPGMMFEVDLTKPLEVPLAAVEAAERAAGTPSSEEPPAVAGVRPPMAAPVTAEPPSPVIVPAAPAPGNPSDAVAANHKPAPPLPPTAPSPVSATPVEATSGGYTLKVNVNLVLVEATVRDDRGQIIEGLKRDDFRVLEDGVEQQIRYFSRDELPLAIALVVDRSGSIAPYLNELRQAALTTLSQLKPEDEVALFSFASTPERLEYLTTDRARIADAISNIQPGGGTNITDALFNAAVYLGRAANHRRHAIILISDNQGTVRGFAGDKGVIRMALETETVIYSVRIGGGAGIRGLTQPFWVPGTGSVNKITHETGGEIIAASGGSLDSAMAAVISRLKQRYTLGYHSTNPKRDGAFREIEVRLAASLYASGPHYNIYARRGYYAPLEHVAARTPSN